MPFLFASFSFALFVPGCRRPILQDWRIQRAGDGERTESFIQERNGEAVIDAFGMRLRQVLFQLFGIRQTKIDVLHFT